MAKNIRYKSPEIGEFYRTHRIRWNQFYDSERVMMERLGMSSSARVLDIGCGCAGLGMALEERFGVRDYTGIEINEQAAEAGRSLYPAARIIAGDILEISPDELGPASFDFVISFGCIDWNVRFIDMLARAFLFVRPGGYFISSFRITPHGSLNDIERSYQYINFDGEKTGETAPYVVINACELIRLLRELNPDAIRGYGYWGSPSATAVTRDSRICFAVIGIQKALKPGNEAIIELDLPPEILKLIA